MRWIAIAVIAAATTLTSVPAKADCVGDWEHKTIDASGRVRDVDTYSWGWSIEVLLETNDGCEIEDIFAPGNLPSQCRVGGRFEVAGHFHYDDDSEYHFYLLMDDILAIHADSIACR